MDHGAFVIEAEQLTKRYDKLAAADRVSFHVKAGEVVGLLGPNGAGKTTVLRMLAGILRPSEGHARVDGIDAAQDAFAVKRRLGFLSGDTALYQRLSPREMLQFFGRLHQLSEREIDARIKRLAEELRMNDFIDQRCATLSAGQKQRANIARAFLHDPPALVLDEPTTALDLVTGRFLLDAIARARLGGKAILFSTHVMGEAEHLCDRVLLLHRGKIVSSGTIAEVCGRSGARSLAEAFLKHIDELDA
jgi:sodium transport system ATP-binding protein